MIDRNIYEKYSKTEVIGETYQNILRQCAKIIKHQTGAHPIKNGIKGFLFYGTPGTGKTTIAMQIPQMMAKPEPARHILYKDCADLAYPKYGHTERELRKVFNEGKSQTEDLIGGVIPVIYIFDDADGLFLTRSFGSKLDSWFLSQLNVFFHQLDQIDTSKECVICTTNRKDLLDHAVVDRLYPIEFPDPAKSVLKAAARNRALNELKMKEVEVKGLEARIDANDNVKTFRDMERILYEYYIDTIMKK